MCSALFVAFWFWLDSPMCWVSVLVPWSSGSFRRPMLASDLFLLLLYCFYQAFYIPHSFIRFSIVSSMHLNYCFLDVPLLLHDNNIACCYDLRMYHQPFKLFVLHYYSHYIWFSLQMFSHFLSVELSVSSMNLYYCFLDVPFFYMDQFSLFSVIKLFVLHYCSMITILPAVMNVSPPRHNKLFLPCSLTTFIFLSDFSFSIKKSEYTFFHFLWTIWPYNLVRWYCLLVLKNKFVYTDRL